ncbi:MAG: alpha/beta fold hydrolase [Acidimicrobiia bacterium]|nr:alpha/beta fold hydrolase [Acidimicrobiia bacterium]
MWRHVVPLLAPHLDVIALTAPGHRGGPEVTRVRGVSGIVDGIVDGTESQLDDLGLDRPHVAGNSLGGWVGLELARRGRATSVCALSPAGCWEAGTPEQTHGTSRLKAIIRATKLGRPALPLLGRIPAVRRFALRDSALHGDHLSTAELLELADDLLACTVRDDVLETDEQLAPLDPLPCPVTVAWSEHDRILPLRTSGARARDLMPEAEFRVLPGVGHVPMIDDPQLVADVILESTRRR